jgi:hydrogenase maturation protein HypF
MALSHLADAGVAWHPDLAPVQACLPDELAILQRQVSTGFLATRTSSMGRLFDAVSSISGVCQVAEHEAEASMRFEGLAATIGDREVTPYRFDVDGAGGLLVARPGPVIRAVAADVQRGVSAAESPSASTWRWATSSRPLPPDWVSRRPGSAWSACRVACSSTRF